jgi:hypothetical protein
VLKTTLDPQIECASFSVRMESRQDPSWPLSSISEVSRSLRATLKFRAQDSRRSPSKTMLRLRTGQAVQPLHEVSVAATYLTCSGLNRCRCTCPTSQRAKLYVDKRRASRTGGRARRESAARAVQVVGWRSATQLFNRDSSRSFLRHFENSRIGTHAAGEAFSAKARIMMKHRNIEYTILQGIERGVWKWSASVEGVVLMGHAAIKSQAVTAAEKAIDRALAAKKVRLAPPEDND